MDKRRPQPRLKTAAYHAERLRNVPLWLLWAGMLLLLFITRLATAQVGAAHLTQATDRYHLESDAELTEQYDAGMLAYAHGRTLEALRLLEPVARTGDSDAQYLIASIFDESKAGPQSQLLAAAWYRQAATQGHPEAQFALGVAYRLGQGVHPDLKQALAWWRAAALQGNVPAQVMLGYAYAVGEHGDGQDLVSAVRWWRKAADNDDALAQYNLAGLYAAGEGVGKSYCEAARWWERSANNGNRQAADALASVRGLDEFAACQ